MATDNQTTALTEQIASAFADVQHPDPGRLLRADAGWEGANLQPLVAGMRWQEIPADVIRRYPTALLLLTPQGFRFLLPAYLLAALRDPEEVDVLPELVFLTLTPSGSDWNRNRLQDQVSLLTQQHWDAARSFVIHHLNAEQSYSAEQRDCALSFWCRNTCHAD
jgi:hypothetical protein